MSKRALTIVLATLMAVGIYSAVANAGVEGSFTFDISITPQTTGLEVSKFDFDWEGLLLLDITISGLTFSNDIALGIAGMEHYVADLSTTLGALDLTDIFVFAVPYNKDKKPIGSMLFVKKKVETEITIGGLSVGSTVIFEDISFPVDSWCAANLGLTPSDLTSYTHQTFAFGGWIDISGTTVSGIGVESITGINADPQDYNCVKKWYELGKVQTESLEFTVEKIIITGIPLGPLTIDKSLEFRPGTPLAYGITIYYALMGIDITAAFKGTDISAFPTYDSATYVLAVDGLTLTWVDGASGVANWVIDGTDLLSAKLVLDIQGATLTAYAKTVPASAIEDGYVSMSIPVSVGTLTAKLVYAGGSWSYYYFDLASDVGGLSFDIWTTFLVGGMDSAGITISIPFSM